MDNVYSAIEKDEIIRDAFSNLASKGISSKWANSHHPFTKLREESLSLMKDSAFWKDLEDYLKNQKIATHAVRMFFTQISMSARTNWHDAPDWIGPVTARGWFLGRWIPTFLIIDGPIGRFVCKGGIPLFENLKDQYSTYPLLASAQDFLNNNFFTDFRNGFAHWTFDGEVVGHESYLVSYSWETGKVTAKLHQKEVDAFHIIASVLIEVLDEVIISR